MSTNKKYLAKEVINVNENLKIYRYYYTWGTTLYITPRNSEEKVIVVHIPYPTEAERLALIEEAKTKLA